MTKIKETATYQLEYLVVQYGGEVELKMGDIIVKSEEHSREQDTEGLTILRVKAW